VSFFLLGNRVQKFLTLTHILSNKLTTEYDIKNLFSDLESSTISLQTFNVKYSKNAIIKNGPGSLLIVALKCAPKSLECIQEVGLNCSLDWAAAKGQTNSSYQLTLFNLRLNLYKQFLWATKSLYNV